MDFTDNNEMINDRTLSDSEDIQDFEDYQEFFGLDCLDDDGELKELEF